MAVRTPDERSTANLTDDERDAFAELRAGAEGVREAAVSMAARVPEMAQATRGAVAEAVRQMDAGSDEMLTAGTSLSLGLAIGMLIGGANRFLVALALVPVAAMGLTLLDRQGRLSHPKPATPPKS